jgi:hypothetical protein
MNWRQAIDALLGISAYQPPPAGAGPTLDSDLVHRARERMGGQLAPQPSTVTRWYLRDLETAVHLADAGDLSPAAQLYRSFRRDGVISGLLATRTGGLVRLPKRFRGDSEVKAALEKTDGTSARSVFEDMLPSAELALMAADGICLGVGIGELVPVEGRDFPVLVRLEPEFLRYRWNEGRWYYNSIAGAIPVTPGDGRWVLHVPCGRMAPWQHGLWQALGASWINKSHAMMHRSNYSAKLANPARAAVSPNGATEAQRQGFLSNLIAWGVNTVFELPAGYDVKIIESNGRGYEVFAAEIETSDNEIMISLAGQIVTTTGGSGFTNADVGKSIRADLIKETADALAYTVNTQCLPQFVVGRWGLDKLQAGGAVVDWIVDPPKDVKTEAEALKAFGEALNSITVGLAPYGRSINVGQLAVKFGIPILGDEDGDGNPEADAPVPALPDAEAAPEEEPTLQ